MMAPPHKSELIFDAAGVGQNQPSIELLACSDFCGRDDAQAVGGQIKCHAFAGIIRAAELDAIVCCQPRRSTFHEVYPYQLRVTATARQVPELPEGLIEESMQRLEDDLVPKVDSERLERRTIGGSLERERSSRLKSHHSNRGYAEVHCFRSSDKDHRLAQIRGGAIEGGIERTCGTKSPSSCACVKS